MKKRNISLLGFVSMALLAGAQVAHAQTRSGLFPRQDGKSIYEGLCLGCHAAGGKGAVGAGSYPALARNPNLEEPGYPVVILIRGQKAMPPMGSYLTDAQIANVVNYIRANFGNRYLNKVTAAEVKAMR